MGPLAEYHEHLRAGRFMLQHCATCRAVVFSPRLYCPACKSDALRWQPAAGGGTVYAVTVIARRPDKGGDYNVVLVDLDDGPRMMSRVVGVPAYEVRIGMRVRALITPGSGDEEPLVEFEPG
ncbi:MAG: nucleic-acid-binding protein containing a Zn-ribbon [Ramlibacter sp.]|jgi:uncharacterized OB-fold protein|nr:nucleic-acid-binding protein containing a Zn-ribbon [Ramlibacter sp.]